MSDFTFVSVSGDGLAKLVEIVGEASLLTEGDKLEKLSKDFYWYSPWLREALDDKKAAAVAKVNDLETLKQVVALAYKEGWPITLRGGGTGNYGQCIPLCGGLVLDLSGMDTIHSLEDGVVRAEPGARLGKIEPLAREKGYEFRCLPSTWVKSSLAGFLCGGSGGIGSIAWGGIANRDNVKSITLLSVEEEPRLLKFEERDALTALHTYGTTGIMVEVEMRLAPKQAYRQLILSSADWDRLLEWTDSIARRVEIPKRLVTQFENPVPSFFRPLKKYLIEGEHATFLLIEKDHADAVVAEAEAAGFTCVYDEPLKDPLKPPYITDYTWNHGTLWAIKADENYTYLQVGYKDNFAEQIKDLQNTFPGEIFQHLEWTAWQTEKENGEWQPPKPDDVGVGGLPKIYYKSRERLQEIIDYCASIDVGVANPHTPFLEEGGRHPDLEAKHKLKDDLDPGGLLNPGKMKTHANKRFLEASLA
jgi:FAD/FMN-containing dehydrogenase